MITNLSTCVKAWYNAICNYSSQYKDHDNGVSRSCQGHSFISIMHGIWLVAYMCDTCSIPFSGTGNSFPCTKSWLDAIWDHNWTFKHHLIAISRSFKVHPYMLDMIHMARPVLNHFIWLLTYQRVSKHDIMQYVTIAHNIKTTITAFQGHVKVIHSYQSCMAYD